MHQPRFYEGPIDPESGVVYGEVVNIVKALDKDAAALVDQAEAATKELTD